MQPRTQSSVLFHDWYRIKLMCLLKIYLHPGLSTKNDIRRKKKEQSIIRTMFYLSSCQSQTPTTSNGNLTIPTFFLIIRNLFDFTSAREKNSA